MMECPKDAGAALFDTVHKLANIASKSVLAGFSDAFAAPYFDDWRAKMGRATRKLASRGAQGGYEFRPVRRTAIAGATGRFETTVIKNFDLAPAIFDQ